MRRAFGLSAEPGSRAYIWANRISWCVGIFAALVLFALVSHWYIALPVALFGCWVTTSLCGLLWYELREALNCTDRLHRILSGITLILAVPAGCIAFYLVPNWSDFEYNGHPSLVALAGSVLFGMLSFILAAGVVAFLGVLFSVLLMRFLRRNTHSYKVGVSSELVHKTMLFKKKIPVEEYCRQNLTTLFSKEREATWETLRRACNDSPLSQVDAQVYYRHLRAVFIQLMLIGITKNCSMDASSDAHVFVMLYLKEHGYPEIHEISRDYNRAFASSGLAPNRDGVAEMVAHFAGVLTSDRLRQETIERLYVEFYAILKIFFDDFRSIKLVSSR